MLSLKISWKYFKGEENMVKTQIAVKRHTDRALTFPKFQKYSKKAFSIAEALIALLIGSLILGMSAPMISKQLKFQNYSDIQIRQIIQRLELLEEERVPRGTVAFFNSNVKSQSSSNPCPKGWSAVPSDWNGRFFRVADIDNPRNELQSQSIQAHWHDMPSFSLSGMTGAQLQTIGSQVIWLSADGYESKYLSGIGSRDPKSAFAGDVFREKDSFVGEGRWMFETEPGNRKNAPTVSNDDETRPKNVALLACVKN